jgi:hypothetical protein
MIEELSLTVPVDYLASVIEANVREIQRSTSKVSTPSYKSTEAVQQELQSSRTATIIQIPATSGDGLEGSHPVKPPATDSPQASRAAGDAVLTAHLQEKTEIGSLGELSVASRETSSGSSQPMPPTAAGDLKAVDSGVTTISNESNSIVDIRLRSKSAGTSVEFPSGVDSSPVQIAAVGSGDVDGETPSGQSGQLNNSTTKPIENVFSTPAANSAIGGDMSSPSEVSVPIIAEVGAAVVEGITSGAALSALESGQSFTSTDSITAASADHHSAVVAPVMIHFPSEDQINAHSFEAAVDSKSEAGDSDDNVSGFDEEDSLIEAEMNRIEKEAGHARRAFESRIQKHKIIQVLRFDLVEGNDHYDPVCRHHVRMMAII